MGSVYLYTMYAIDFSQNVLSSLILSILLHPMWIFHPIKEWDETDFARSTLDLSYMNFFPTNLKREHETYDSTLFHFIVLLNNIIFILFHNDWCDKLWWELYHFHLCQLSSIDITFIITNEIRTYRWVLVKKIFWKFCL